MKVTIGMSKGLICLSIALLLLGCKEEQQAMPECDDICAEFESSTTSVMYSTMNYRNGFKEYGSNQTRRKSTNPKATYPATGGKREKRLSYISITKTATGAIAKYKSWQDSDSIPVEAKFSMDEWQDFIKDLYKSRITELEEKDTRMTYEILEIYSLNKDNPIRIDFRDREDNNVYSEFWKLMNRMETKIKTKIEAELETEYKKKFETPITDFERTMYKVVFDVGETAVSYMRLAVIRTKTGAIAKYWKFYPLEAGALEAELSMDEWLDFIMVLYKNRIDKDWKYEPKTYGRRDQYWSLDISFSDKERSYNDKDRYSFHGAGGEYPPNWKDFRRVMSDMEIVIKKKAD